MGYGECVQLTFIEIEPCDVVQDAYNTSQLLTFTLPFLTLSKLAKSLVATLNVPFFTMPLSLRRSHNTPQTTARNRTVSTPTFLSRIRSSAFASSKVSMLATSPYDNVKARTPPIPISLPIGAPRPLMRRPKPYGALHARWRVEAGRLSSPEHRDCLFGAECLEITDPLLGRIGECPVQAERIVN